MNKRPSISGKKINFYNSIVVVVALFAVGCESEGPVIKNPFKKAGDTIQTTKDTWNYRTIQGLHAGLFKPTCANSGCHDGNFEPDFRTVESSYYSLVNHSVTKPDFAGKFKNRVVPFSSTSSMLPQRLLIDLNGNSGIMPLSLEPNSNYPVQKDSWMVRLNDWINAGAKDWLGKTPETVDFPPQVLGVQFLVGGVPLFRAGKYEAAQISVGQSPTLWVSLSDDNTVVSGLKNVTVNWSSDPANFDPAKEMSMTGGPNKNLSGLFASSCDYYWNFLYDGSKHIENDVIWFRITLSDAKNTNYQIPNNNSMFLLKTYFAIKYK